MTGLRGHEVTRFRGDEMRRFRGCKSGVVGGWAGARLIGGLGEIGTLRSSGHWAHRCSGGRTLGVWDSVMVGLGMRGGTLSSPLRVGGTGAGCPSRG